MSRFKIFLLTFALTFAVALGFFYRLRPARMSPPQSVAPGVFFSAQLAPHFVPRLETRGIRTIVDIRPDGEEADQPDSASIAEAAAEEKIKFHYIPVPHGSIPDEAVSALAQVLASEPAPVLLYCRSGRRAVRLFALAEASRPGGPDLPGILQMVESAGFTASDLSEDISGRISRRAPAAPTPP